MEARSAVFDKLPLVMAELETVIGLECHVELSTRTKMFCGCRNGFGDEPNTNVCPVCLGHPGTLPVPNREAIASIMKIGQALDCAIAPHSLFHRKNYFYPDMPKNFQISQYDLPICVGGHLDVDVDGVTRRIGITRVHMEEDTGKTTHGSASGRIHEADFALIDYNRAGVPLVECVSEPDMRSPEEAAAYLPRAARDARVARCERRADGGGVAPLRREHLAPPRRAGRVRHQGRDQEHELRPVDGARAELRDRAPDRRRIENGEPIVQETRHWDEDAGATKSMRSKEEAFDYRYFPEPDIPPLEPSDAWVGEIRATAAGASRAPAASGTRRSSV